MNESTPISEEDAKKIYREISKVEIVYPLVRVFRREADPLTLRYKLGGDILYKWKGEG